MKLHQLIYISLLPQRNISSSLHNNTDNDNDNNDSTQYLYSVYSGPGYVISYLLKKKKTPVILTRALWVMYHYLHFTDKGTETQRLNNLPTITQQPTGRTKSHSHGVFLQKPCFRQLWYSPAQSCPLNSSSIHQPGNYVSSLFSSFLHLSTMAPVSHVVNRLKFLTSYHTG